MLWIAFILVLFAREAAVWSIALYLAGAALELVYELVFGLSPMHTTTTLLFAGMKWAGLVAMIIT